MSIIKDHSFIHEEYQNSDVLLVIFGGIRQGMGLPNFEFKNVLNEVPCNKLFIRDFKQAWYHYGINDNINNIETLCEFLREFIIKYKKVVFIGNSMGGYAAILFGTLLNVNKIVAFSPQTFIDKWNRFLYRDKRWKQQITKIHNSKYLKNRIFDLKSFLKNKKFKLVSTTIYYSNKHSLDKKHCERLKGFDGFYFEAFDSQNHNIVKQLRDDGQLIKIITNQL